MALTAMARAEGEGRGLKGKGAGWWRSDGIDRVRGGTVARHDVGERPGMAGPTGPNRTTAAMPYT